MSDIAAAQRLPLRAAAFSSVLEQLNPTDGEDQAGGTVFDGMKKCTFAPSTDEGSTATGSNPSPMATDSAVSRAGAALAGAVAAAAFLA